MVCFDLIGHHHRVRFINVYRPPGYDSNAVQYMCSLTNRLTALCNIDHTIAIVGDLNLPKMEWYIPCCPNCNIHNPFLRFVMENSLSQLVDFATRDNNILDVILTNDVKLFSHVRPDAPVGASDHSSVKFCMEAPSKPAATVHAIPPSMSYNIGEWLIMSPLRRYC